MDFERKMAAAKETISFVTGADGVTVSAKKKEKAILAGWFIKKVL